jgi:peptide-methionine (S)-S-oxide reductase
VKGVREAISGYTGGVAATADYGDVSTGTTGHAESLKIIFDPSIVSYGTLLRIYFSVAANPTELNYQYPDHGPQYRGEIWTADAAQRHIAEAYIQQLTADHAFPAPIVTRVDKMMPFYAAEDYHQNYATLNPDSPYIMIYDAPKVAALAQMFPALYNPRPVLVAAGAG